MDYLRRLLLVIVLKMWFTSVAPIILCCSAAVSCIDFPALVADYARKVKGFDALTVLSCPTRTKVQSWNLISTQGILFQLIDFTQGLKLSRVESESNCRQLIVIDLSCPGFQELIVDLSDQDQFKSHCRAFLLYNAQEDETWYERELQPILLITEFTFVSNVCFITAFRKNSTSNKELYIYDLWNPGRSQGGVLKMDLIGMYKESTKMFVELDPFSAAVQRRTNLSELHLQCAIVVTSPFNGTLESYITNNYNPNFDTVHRLNFRTINLVQDYFNFKLHVKRTHSWGYIQNASTTTFDGMVGMVQRREVDFGCSPAWFRTERLQVVDYGSQTWAIRPIFLFRHPNTKGLGRNVFLEPFEDSVWTVLLISSIIIIFMMTNTVQQEKYTMRQFENKGTEVSTVFGNLDKLL